MTNKYAERINLLRHEMEKEGLECYVIYNTDSHASEYVGEHFKVIEWLTGFTGSNATVVVTRDLAFLWTDGRYFLQAGEELKGTGVELMKDGEPGVPTVEEYVCKFSIIGFDGLTTTHENAVSLSGKTEAEATEKRETDPVAAEKRGEKSPKSIALIDRIWTDRPPVSHNDTWELGLEYAGESTESKLQRLRTELAKLGVDGVLITTLADIAWLYNYRGSDIAFTPVAMAYALVTMDDDRLYIRDKYEAVFEDLKNFGGKLLLDEETVNADIASLVEKPVYGVNPTGLMKAVKNETEVENEKLAHLKDGVCLTKTIYWLKKLAGLVDAGTSAVGSNSASTAIHSETELSVEAHLTALRKAQEHFVDLSFTSIVATGEHGAIVHYEPTEESNRPIEDGYLLIDTGAHYLEGTTDVTRTVSIGEPTEEMKKHYTAVLKGHIDVAMQVFPMGAKGKAIDDIAREPLRKMGLDYKHGTGHGVGYLLSVHEGPNSIRTKDGAAFLPGMITSDEPGVYLEGQYGIRIENLVLTVPAGDSIKQTLTVPAASDNLAFEPLTLAPYDKASIVFEELTADEKAWLEEYNKTLYDKLAPHLTEEELAWLLSEIS